MIDEGVLTRAIETLLNDTATLDDTVTIERSTRINFDPARCPWIGVYPGEVVTKPKTLGAGSARWNSAATPMIVVQTMSYEGDGQTASDQLETLIQTIQEVIDADLTLGVAGARVVGISREYKYVVMDGDESGSLFMPQCVIKLSMEVRSS